MRTFAGDFIKFDFYGDFYFGIRTSRLGRFLITTVPNTRGIRTNTLCLIKSQPAICVLSLYYICDV